MNNGVSGELLQAIVVAFNDHDPARMMSFFADD